MICKWRELEFEPTHMSVGCKGGPIDQTSHLEFTMRPADARLARAALLTDPFGVVTIRIGASTMTVRGRLCAAHSEECTRQDADPLRCDCCSFRVQVLAEGIQIAPHDAAEGRHDGRIGPRERTAIVLTLVLGFGVAGFCSWWSQ